MSFASFLYETNPEFFLVTYLFFTKWFRYFSNFHLPNDRIGKKEMEQILEGETEWGKGKTESEKVNREILIRKERRERDVEVEKKRLWEGKGRGWKSGRRGVWQTKSVDRARAWNTLSHTVGRRQVCGHNSAFHAFWASTIWNIQVYYPPIRFMCLQILHQGFLTFLKWWTSKLKQNIPRTTDLILQ